MTAAGLAAETPNKHKSPQKSKPDVIGFLEKGICFDRTMQNTAFLEGIPLQAIFDQRRRVLQQSHDRKTEHPIPKISHHIWVTDPAHPREVSDKNLGYMKATLSLLPTSKGWRHILWTNAPDLIPKTIRSLRPYGLQVKVINRHNLKALQTHYAIYLKAYRFNLAAVSDVVRAMSVHQYGGFYFDVDHQLLQPIDALTTKYSFIIAEEGSGNRLDNCAFGAAPRHPILTEALRMLTKHFSSHPPGYVLAVQHDHAFTIAATGPLLFSLAFFRKANAAPGLNDTLVIKKTGHYPGIPVLEPKAFGAQHYSASWVTAEGQRQYPHCRRIVTNAWDEQF